jgi:hypothetical protein
MPTITTVADLDRRTTRRNVLALVGDFFFFSVGFAFCDPLVVVPAFVEEFTGSGLLVGVLAALRMLFITVPQLWAASVLEVQPKMKPLLVWSSIGGRLPVLLLALSVLLWAETQIWLVILILAVSVMLFFTSEGLNSVSWPALVGKVVPEDFRGRFFGIGQLLASFGAAATGHSRSGVFGPGRALGSAFSLWLRMVDDLGAEHGLYSREARGVRAGQGGCAPEPAQNVAVSRGGPVAASYDRDPVGAVLRIGLICLFRRAGGAAYVQHRGDDRNLCDAAERWECRGCVGGWDVDG